MMFGLLAGFAALIVGLDQWTKALTVAGMELYQQVEALPGLFHLTYVQNTGAAFSSFQGARWMFVAVFLVFTLALLWEWRKQSLGFTALEWWCLAAVYGGGLGNVIDRIRLGYVVDMIALDFIRFPVFNVADCFITCGSIALMVHLVLFHKDFWKDKA